MHRESGDQNISQDLGNVAYLFDSGTTSLTMLYVQAFMTGVPPNRCAMAESQSSRIGSLSGNHATIMINSTYNVIPTEQVAYTGLRPML